MIAAILRRRPPRWAVCVALLLIGLYLEVRHLPGWGLLLVAAAFIAATEGESD